MRLFLLCMMHLHQKIVKMKKNVVGFVWFFFSTQHKQKKCQRCSLGQTAFCQHIQINHIQEAVKNWPTEHQEDSSFTASQDIEKQRGKLIWSQYFWRLSRILSHEPVRITPLRCKLIVLSLTGDHFYQVVNLFINVINSRFFPLLSVLQPARVSCISSLSVTALFSALFR